MQLGMMKPRATVEALDAGELRRALGSFATGVAIATTRESDGRPIGLTVNSFASVSLSPSLILWSLSLRSPSLKSFRDHPFFAINVLALDQAHVARRFSEPRPDKFATVDWHFGETEVPLIGGSAAAFQCALRDRFSGGDHEIFLGEVIFVEKADKVGLVFAQGEYCRATPHSAP